MKSIKECFQMIKKWFEDPLIRNAITISVVFALCIHFLFSIRAPFRFLEGKWDEAGDILTYVSTIALGILAVWQNQKFKEENDKSQERLEKLTIQANELSIISKIIEAESIRIEQTNHALDKIYSYCDYQKISSLYLNNGLNKIQRNAALTDWRSEMLISFNDVLYQLGRDTCVDISNIIRQVVRLSGAASNFIDVLRNSEVSEYSSEMNDIAKIQLDYVAARGEYFVETDAQYRRLIYGNMSLADIQKTYCKIDQRKAMEEAIKNGENENGVA